MADSNLNTPVIVQATRLDTSILPRNIFSQSYLLYVIAQGTDVGNVANKANEAGQGAYDAQVRNDEQDVILVDHEERIRQLRIDVDDHEIRITANTNAIASLERIESKARIMPKAKTTAATTPTVKGSNGAVINNLDKLKARALETGDWTPYFAAKKAKK
jgi:hypothetical protein